MASKSGGQLAYGIYAYTVYSVSSTATKTTLTVTKALARTSKDNIGVTNIGASYAGTGQTTKTVSGKNMKYSDDVTMFSSFSWSWARGTSDATKTITYKVTYGGGTSTASFNVTVPALAKYTVAYNGNGSTSGSMSTQTKYYGKNLTLRTNAYARTGYTFKNFNTNASGTGTTYSSGGTYTANAGATLYAQWTARTSTISYNANGGSGSIASQTKTYDKALTLSNGSGFIRENHSLTGWNTESDGSGTSYSLSQVIGAKDLLNTNLTLYAQWHLDYIAPSIKNFEVMRVDTAGSTDESDTGTFIYVTFEYKAGTATSGETWETPKCTIEIDGESTTYTGSALPIDSSGQGIFTEWFGGYSIDSTHTVDVSIKDDYDIEATESGDIATATYPIDLLVDGDNVYMGVMHIAEHGKTLTLPDTDIDGVLTVIEDVFIAIDTTEPPDTTTMDGQIYKALKDLSWDSDVIV